MQSRLDRLAVSLALAAALTLAGASVGCRGGGPREERTPAGASSETSPAILEQRTEALEDLDAAKLLGVNTAYAQIGIEKARDGEPQAVGTIETKSGAPEERGVFALLTAMIDAAPEAPSVTVVLWIPGAPDARFAQYVWSRPDLRLERFEASILADEFEAYAPSREGSSDARPSGFQAGRTGLMTGVDAARLGTFATGEQPEWTSNTP